MAIYGPDDHGSFGEVETDIFHSQDCEAAYGCDLDPCTCTPVTLAFLPHQCDSWCIGEREDVERMIEALQIIVEGMPKKSGGGK